MTRRKSQTRVECDSMARNLTKVQKEKSSSTLFKSVSFFVAVVVFATLAFSLTRPSFTGFVSSDVFAADLNLKLESNTEVKIHSDEEIVLKSFALSGFVEGEGPVWIFLENDGGVRYLVYTNVKKKSPLSTITGLSVADSGEPEMKDIVLEINAKPLQEDYNPSLAEDDMIVSGNFAFQCVDTCLLNPREFEGSDFKLLVFVDSDTILTLNFITYSAE